MIDTYRVVTRVRPILEFNVKKTEFTSYQWQMHLQSAFPSELPGCGINGTETVAFSDHSVRNDSKVGYLENGCAAN